MKINWFIKLLEKKLQMTQTKKDIEQSYNLNISKKQDLTILKIQKNCFNPQKR